MSWLEQLRQASFRGVRFWVDTSTDYVGREYVVRDYPFQDKPTVQDVGGVSKPGSFAAYVAGEDAFDHRDELIRALNKRGPGELVHPWFGVRNVTILGPVPVRHSTAEGGVVRFDIEFIHAEQTRYPTVAKNTARVVKGNVLSARLKAIEDFARRFSVDKLAGWAVDSSLGALGKAVGDIQATVKTLVGIPAGYLAAFDTQVRLFSNVINTLPSADLGAGLLGLLDSLHDFDPAGDSESTEASERRTLFNDTLNRQKMLFNWSSGYKPKPYQTPTRQREADNHAAIENLIRIGSVLATAETISKTDFSDVWSYSEAMQWRATLNSAFQAVLESADSHIYQDLLLAMTAVSDDMVTRSRHLGRVSTITTRPVYMSALLVSYEQYGTIDHADEIALNNRITNPLFIEPGTVLEVVSHD
jgi:prophage DNA circulation protein